MDYNKLSDNGFDSLRVRVGRIAYEYPAPLMTHIVVLQIENNGNGRTLIDVEIPYNTINREEVLDKLIKEFGGKRIKEDFKTTFKVAEIKNKKHQALDWLESIAVMGKMISC